MIEPNQIQTPDKQTLIFKLNEPYAPFTRMLASPSYGWIFPREVLAGAYNPLKTVIGSGPLILANTQPDVAYTFKRNADWFDKPRPSIDVMRVAVIPSAAQQLAQFSAGNLDVLELRGGSDLAAAKQDRPSATVMNVAFGGFNGLFFQLGDTTSPFRDIRVRRAFSTAFDRDAIGKAVYEGDAVQSVFLSASLGKWALAVGELDPSVGQYYKYNPAEAKQLLAAAGQTNLQVRLASIAASQGMQDGVKVQEVMNGMLNAVGIRSAIVNLDFTKDFLGPKGVRSGYYDKDMVLTFTNIPYIEADEALFGYLHSKSTTNIEHLHDPAYDAMVDKQRSLLNEDERVKAVQVIQRYLAEKMYVPSTVGPYKYELVQPRVHNFSYSDTMGLYTENYAKVWLGT